MEHIDDKEGLERTSSADGGTMERETDGENVPAEEVTSEAAEDTAGQEKEGFSLPEGAVDEYEIVDRDFWKGITLPDIAPKKKTDKRHMWFTLVTSLVFLAAGFGIACVSARGQGVLSNLVTGGKHMTFSLPVADKPEENAAQRDESGKYTAQGIAEACSPSVVLLDIYTDKSSLIPAGQGSGIIMSEDGYIVSNAHVVDKASAAIKAVLSDGREYAAELIGSDPKTDIAVIKIPAADLTPAEFGNSDDVKLGEEVVAIGSPAGYRNSVTKGIVSGLDRIVRLENSSAGVNCIQIDAAVNPGNSGGALFNMWGQVIGITSSKLSSADYEGIGFAISTNQAKDIIEQLMEYGHVMGRVKIGISYYPVSQTTAEIYGVKAGICVAEIDQSCDVADTELKEGDIITQIDGVDVAGVEDIPGLVNEKNAGDEVTCHVYRAGTETEAEKEFDITFRLMEDEGTLTEAE